MGSLITLASRLITQSTKSSVSDKVRPLNEKDKSGKPKFGAQTVDDVIVDFLTNKLSPAARTAWEFGKDEKFGGEKPTVANEALDLVTPLPIKNAIETFQDPNSAPALAALLADALGIGTNTYGGSKQIQADIKRAKARGDRKEIERLENALKLTLAIEAKKNRERKLATSNGAKKPSETGGDNADDGN
jgi:hypothetical protein